MENYKLTYNVDMVFCIDATGSMRHVLDFVKQNALNLYHDIVAEMEKKHKTINQLRVRVIAFRDYVADGKDAILGSDFFVLPDQAQMFYDCVNGITAKGGGDIPEDGLEALAYLGYGKMAPWYPEGMAKDFDELSLWWEDEQLGGGMDENAKRLLIFAPDAPSWNRISSEWGQVIHVQTVSEGLLDVEYRQVLDAVCNTI